MVIVDTNVIIDHLRQAPSKSKLIQVFKDYPEEKFGLALISLQELYAGTSTRKEAAEQGLLSTLAKIEILQFTYEIARLGGMIVRDLPRTIELADAAIAATAIINQAKLFTLDKKDFAGIDKLQLFPWKKH